MNLMFQLQAESFSIPVITVDGTKNSTKIPRFFVHTIVRAEGRGRKNSGIPKNNEFDASVASCKYWYSNSFCSIVQAMVRTSRSFSFTQLLPTLAEITIIMNVWQQH
jgi:hypothetical protein